MLTEPYWCAYTRPSPDGQQRVLIRHERPSGQFKPGEIGEVSISQRAVSEETVRVAIPFTAEVAIYRQVTAHADGPDAGIAAYIRLVVKVTPRHGDSWYTVVGDAVVHVGPSPDF